VCTTRPVANDVYTQRLCASPVERTTDPLRHLGTGCWLLLLLGSDEVMVGGGTQGGTTRRF